MNNLKDKNTDPVAATVDRLRGFDSRRLQCEMTDGLAEWHRHCAEGARNRRLYLVATAIAFLMVSCAFRLAPTLDYRLADGESYQEVEALTNHLLGK